MKARLKKQGLKSEAGKVRESRKEEKRVKSSKWKRSRFGRPGERKREERRTSAGKAWVAKKKTCAVLKVRKERDNISGDNSLRDPPVPIPNTEVKPQHADGTWLETARESRTSPDPISAGVLPIGRTPVYFCLRIAGQAGASMLYSLQKVQTHARHDARRIWPCSMKKI